jgi:Cof subfamily protein (haloacid dehalogenase superfamily)
MNDMNKNKTMVLVLDIDGTLTNSQKEITEKTKNAIIDTMKRGHKVILASGRPTYGMHRYEKELELKENGGFLLSFNGGRVVDCASGEVIYQKTLPKETIPKLYDFAKKHQCGLITYENENIILGTEMDEYIAIESRINGMEIKKVDHFTEYVDFDVNKCLMTAPPKQAEKYTEMLQEELGDTLSIYRSEPFFIEIMPKGIDKANSLDKMLSSVNLYRENTICCGDGYNDISMIQYAGIGVAMENARDEVKQSADFITKSNDKDGIVVVIDKFIE